MRTRIAGGLFVSHLGSETDLKSHNQNNKSPRLGLGDLLFYGYSSFIFDTPYKIKAGTISCSIEPYETMNSPATIYRRFLSAVLIAFGSITVGIIINGVIRIS